MSSVILTKIYAEPPFCQKEILRYAGCKSADEETEKLMKSCIAEAQNILCYKVCFRELTVRADGDCCDFGFFKVQSKKLCANLKNCKRVILFAATVGVGIDRLIAKYGRISPSKALMFQAIGAERIEALCDCFCEDIERENNMSLRPRFSPGYGDLTLECQKDIFNVLDCGKYIGLTLNSSLLMSPSKSVTAFAGLAENGIGQHYSKCDLCDNKDCEFKR